MNEDKRKKDEEMRKRYQRLAGQQSLMMEFLDPVEMGKYSTRIRSAVSVIKAEAAAVDVAERERVLELIREREFDTTESVSNNQKVLNYRLRGYPIEFSITEEDSELSFLYLGVPIKGIVPELLKAAIEFGAEYVEHFDGILTQFYEDAGFEMIRRESWNDDYGLTSHSTFGKPSVIYRKLKK